MANFLYNVGREGFLTTITVGALTEQTDWVNDNIRVALVYDDYVGDAASHDSYDNVAADVAGAGTADIELAGRGTTGDGTALASTSTFAAVASPPGTEEISSVVIYKSDTGDFGTQTPANCPLIAHLDDAIAGLPIVPNGGDITILWNSGGGEIFRI